MLLLDLATICPLPSVIFRTKVLTFSNVKLCTLKINPYTKPSKLGKVRIPYISTELKTEVRHGPSHLNIKPGVLDVV